MQCLIVRLHFSDSSIPMKFNLISNSGILCLNIREVHFNPMLSHGNLFAFPPILVEMFKFIRFLGLYLYQYSIKVSGIRSTLT
jgi:hypothetical protein